MSTRQYLIDAATRHQVFIQRYAGGQSKKAIKTLNRLRREINARLSHEPTNFQAGRLNALLEDLNKLEQAAFGEITGRVKKGAYDLSKSEAAFSVKLFDKGSSANFTLPTTESIISAVENKSLSARKGAMGVKLDDVLAEYGTKKSAQITQIIRDGVTLGDTTPTISRKVGQIIDTLHRRQLDVLVRTVVNHASAVAREQVYTDNSQLLDGYEWVSTLDSSTTLICASRDGQVYETGIGPMPPQHFGCRSVTIPKINEAFTLGSKIKGKRPSVGGAGAKEISSGTSYGGWLKKQPREFIDEALGVERSRVFRSGKLKISEFVDPTGRVYTLAELERMHPFVFQDM